MKPEERAFFDEATYAATHVAWDPDTRVAAVIDSVRDYDPKPGRTGTALAADVITFVRRQQLSVEWTLETHVHADHLSAAPYLKRELGGRIGIGSGIATVQGVFKGVFNADEGFATDGRQFDHLFEDGETFRLRGIEARAMHTPAGVTYLIGDAAFVGDTLFMPDFGTARCDFPGGDARTLYRSVQKIPALPAGTRLLMCHDYAPDGRDYRWATTVAAERAQNIHVRDGVSEDEFVRMRTERDATLDMPVLILPQVQVNIRAGALPPAEDNGLSYLKIPVDAL